MMLLKPLTLAAVLIFSSGIAWAQGGNPSAPETSDARPGKARPSVSDESRPGASRSTPKADGSSESRDSTSTGMSDATVGNGTGRADEDASAAAAR